MNLQGIPSTDVLKTYTTEKSQEINTLSYFEVMTQIFLSTEKPTALQMAGKGNEFINRKAGRAEQ